jgi:L-cysteate sulfo-lyase
VTPADLEQRLALWPRLSYLQGATPLEPLPRLSRRLGGPRLWLKRDDGIGPAMGGNKGRKLEFLMADAMRQGKRRVVTFGGLQSNHARMTAAACAHLGLEAHLFFFEKRPPEFSGNLLLNRLLGARMHFVPFGGGGQAALTIERANRLAWLVSLLRLGPGAYFIPVGGHNVTGCLGYVAAAAELQRQVETLDLDAARVTVVTAVGTGGTLAGLLAGLVLLNSPMQLLGIDVGKLWRSFPASLARLATELCRTLGEPHHFAAEEVPLIEGDYVGPGYAVFDQSCHEAICMLAQSEGVIVDPVYSGKAFSGLLDLVQRKRFNAGHEVIFLHTGGTAGLWAYADPLLFYGLSTPADRNAAKQLSSLAQTRL